MERIKKLNDAWRATWLRWRTGDKCGNLVSSGNLYHTIVPVDNSINWMPKTASSSFVLPFRCRRSNPYDKEEMDSYDSLNDLMEQQHSSPPLSSPVPPPLPSAAPLPLPSAAPLPLPISIPSSLPSSVPPPPRPPQKTLSKCVPGVEGSLFEKPLYSYATLIGKAILDTQEKRARLSFIYHWIATRFPFYRLDQGGWQVSEIAERSSWFIFFTSLGIWSDSRRVYSHISLLAFRTQ